MDVCDQKTEKERERGSVGLIKNEINNWHKEGELRK